MKLSCAIRVVAVMLATTCPAALAQDTKKTAAQLDAEQAPKRIPTKIEGQYQGGQLVELRVHDRLAYVVKPTGKIDAQKRWLWVFPFWLGINNGLGQLQHRHYIEKLLAAGYHVGGVDVGPSCASPAAAKVSQEFYDQVVKDFGLNKKARILGQSHGGLIAYGWAIRYPECVDRVVGICPATDFTSWPKLPSVLQHPAKGLGYDLTLAELARRAKEFNPIDNLAGLAKSGAKILHLHGDQDDVVPMDANSTELARRYRELGGAAEIVVLPGLKHGGPELYNSAAVRQFLLAD